MYTHVYIYVYISIHTRVCVCLCIYIYMYSYNNINSCGLFFEDQAESKCIPCAATVEGLKANQALEFLSLTHNRFRGAK